MQLHFPSIGDNYKLLEDFSFNVMVEYRNADFLKAFGLFDETKPNYSCFHEKDKFFQVVIPAGAILKIDRIYIRKGAADFDSITFFLDKNSIDYPLKKFKTRFWVNLKDINGKMNVENYIPEEKPKRVKKVK